jgi:hypothetical protein
LLLLERYSVYEIPLVINSTGAEATLSHDTPRRLVDVERCLANEPSLHASGFVDFQLERSANGREIVVLLARGASKSGARNEVRASLRCPLQADGANRNFSHAALVRLPMPAPDEQRWLTACENDGHVYALIRSAASSPRLGAEVWHLQAAPQGKRLQAGLAALVV